MYLRHELGKISEKEVENWFLNSRTARLISRNYRSKTGEIDLIFEEELPDRTRLELVFVEVRSRSKVHFVGGLESITRQKQRRLKLCASHFLSQYNGKAQSMRFDLFYRDGESWGYLPNFWIY